MLESLLQIAGKAGEAILVHYGKEIPVDKKADDSPLTMADRDAHRVIAGALAELTPEIPVISEEAELPGYEVRKAWSEFWLVDPLDGTKEFIKQTGEFTVNIALVRDGVPVIGVVYAPSSGLAYAGTSEGAWKMEAERWEMGENLNSKSAISDLLSPIAAGAYTGGDPVLVASRDHAGPEVQKLADRHPDAQFRSMGSSLKFCLVAEGAADIYLRDVPTMEWDTAAAHAVLNAAGATLRCLDGTPLVYNKEVLRNPAIVTIRPGAERLL